MGRPPADEVQPGARGHILRLPFLEAWTQPPAQLGARLLERWEIVDALIVGGYAEKGVAGTITVTAKGQQYLRTHAS